MLDAIRLEVACIAENQQVRPRVHGNGFVQLDLDPRRRLHIFGDPEIPSQDVPSPIHDHTFGFTSYILKGSLTNLQIGFAELDEGHEWATHMEHMAQVRDREDTILVPTGRSGRAYLERAEGFCAGECYHFRSRLFHETITHGPTVTVIEKDGPTLSQGGPSPRVLVPIGYEPDNSFNRYAVPEEDLWRIIWRNLGEVK